MPQLLLWESCYKRTVYTPQKPQNSHIIIINHLSFNGKKLYWTMTNELFCRQVAKCDPYMPYLTLWDKISQNLAHLEDNSHKKSKSHRIFRPFYNRFYEKININHALLRFSQASLIEKKVFRLYWECSKVMIRKISQNFVKSLLKFCLISQILVHSWELLPYKKVLMWQSSRKHAYIVLTPLNPTFIQQNWGLQEYTLFFLFLLKNIDCGYLLELPQRGSSNEYPQSMFWAEIWTRGPRATGRSPEWHSHCRYADVMQHFSNPVIATIEKIII